LFALTHNGLIKVPAALGDPSIYWLRLYSAHSSNVVVVTEVPGNPGQSVTNAIERVAEFICTSFSLDPIDESGLGKYNLPVLDRPLAAMSAGGQG
jgi:hypothetical protein